ncbi:hypothetical protein NP493_669g00003 [Ridgeia piscesae]|uniref:Uncharacterized protein n=1 Tax=Ridgeia piscesae TaxID=27915 RepID=A0AAD9KS17_RIDPI|nr:hypothetical protein NP493_669g00003 [Ridgeia piscesae]
MICRAAATTRATVAAYPRHMCVNDSVTAAPVNEPRCQPSVVSTPATITNRRGDVDKSLKCVSECWRRYVVYRATRCDTVRHGMWGRRHRPANCSPASL